MVTPITNHSFAFAPTGPYLPQFHYEAVYTPPEKKLKDQVIYYLLRALTIINRILHLLKSSKSFFEQYNPVLKQLPNMYKMLKLIHDVKDETNTTEPNKQVNNEETKHN